MVDALIVSMLKVLPVLHELAAEQSSGSEPVREPPVGYPVNADEVIAID